MPCGVSVKSKANDFPKSKVPYTDPLCAKCYMHDFLPTFTVNSIQMQVHIPYMEQFHLSESKEHQLQSVSEKIFKKFQKKCQPSTIVDDETMLVTLQGTITYATWRKGKSSTQKCRPDMWGYVWIYWFPEVFS